MRLTDDRYRLERHRLRLGLRLLRHEAKNSTIRTCTGLSEDRVRKLFKSYLEGRSATPLRRKRGKSPQEPYIFFRNERAHLQASLLAGALRQLDVVAYADIEREITVTLAERCCDAFEYYLTLFDDALFTFEHAWFLATALGQGRELCFVECAQCHAGLLQDNWAGRQRPCPFCGGKSA